MNIIATSSAGLVVIENEGRCFDYFGVPGRILKKVRVRIRKGRQAWDLLKPYSAKLERSAKVERETMKRGVEI